MIDVAIIGDGVIGLSTALELGRAGATVQLFGADRPGNASEAAAGLLSPSVGQLSAEVRAFYDTSLDLYPDFVARLSDYDPSLAIVQGLIEVTTNARSSGPTSRRLEPTELARIEPSLGARSGAVLHERDGSIDNVRLVTALRLAVGATPSIMHRRNPVTSVEFNAGNATVITESSDRVDAKTVVLAAGAWAAQVYGLPRALPVFPLKGQMLALDSTGIRHPIMSDAVYLVPRQRETVVGATVERAGFDLSVIGPSIEALRQAAVAVCPWLENARIIRTWAGIRPATPDLLPIVGVDPEQPRLIYACGHSKNGILLAPVTAVVVAALAQGGGPIVEIGPFSISRF